MAATCPTCRADVPAGANFCPSCGSPIEGAPTIQERRLVTVLFADVIGSTGLAELMDAERLQEVMSAFFGAMREEIEAEGGSVEKLIGDAVMAIFGLPVAHEDDPARALRAVLRMQDRLSLLNESLARTHGVTLEMRIGVNTGDVLASTGPQPDVGTLAGDAINVAARLEQAAQPGQVLVSERTLRGSRGFAMREVDRLRLRGREKPVRAFELEGADLLPERGIPGIQAPMVGRAPEIELLSALYERVASERTSHLVTIYGAAGVGKSRLVAEFLESVEGRAAVLRGRCQPYGQEVTYWPLAEILKAEAGVLDSDPPDVALEKIRKAGRELLTPLASDPQRSTAALAYTIGLEDPNIPLSQLPPRQVRAETHLAWRSFFSALATKTPVVAVVEDIHWADPALLELLEELADRVEASVLFICPARPELTERRAGWGGGRRNFSSLFLEPLSMDESEELLQLLLEIEELPTEIRFQVLGKAEGNPFFLEEVIRQLIDEGMIARVEGRWRAQATIGDLQIPDTVQAVLAARIDLLAPHEKRVLQCAAVIGRVFWAEPVGVLVGVEDDIEGLLDRLEQRQLVLSRLGSAMAGQPEYIFKHILTRDVAYESLPRRDRARLHAEAARWIERTAGERRREFVELLAGHFFEAHRGMLRDATGWDEESVAAMRADAFRYSLAATEDARSKMALDTAHRLAERALSLAAGSVERSLALEALGRAANLDYRGNLAWRYLRGSVDELLEGAPEERAAIARLAAAAVEVPTRWPGSMQPPMPSEEEVAHYLETGLSNVGEGDSEVMVRLLMARSMWAWGFGVSDAAQMEQARRSGEEAVAMARRLGLADLESAALDGAMSPPLNSGRPGDAMALLDRRLELVEHLQDSLEVGDVFAMAAWVSYDIGRYRESFEFGDEGVRRTIGLMPAVGLHCLARRALARYPMGEWRQLLADLTLAEELLGDRKEDPPYFAQRPFAAAALVHEVQGDAAAANRRLAMFERLDDEVGGIRTAAQTWIAPLLARRKRFEAARALVGDFQEQNRGLFLEAWCTILGEQEAWEEVAGLVGQARAAASEGGYLALPFHADRLEGRAALAQGEADRAVSLLSKAVQGFSGLEAHWESAYTNLWLAEALLLQREPEEARRRLSQATPVFEDLSAVRELAHSSDLLARVDEHQGG